MLVLQRHVYDRADPIDLTDWVTSLNISLSTRQPWSSIDATLRLPFSHRGLAPGPDDWLSVHREESGRAIAWGAIDAGPEPGLVRDGPRLHSGDVRPRATGWLDQLKAAQVYAHSSAGVGSSVGTMFNVEDWSIRATEILNTASGAHGEQLTRLVRLLARLELPQSLGGGQLGHSVAVAHDAATAAPLGLYTAFDRVVGPRLSGDQAWPTSTNVLSMLTGIFRPNEELIEFFETLCPLDLRPGGNFDRILSETREIEQARIEAAAPIPESNPNPSPTPEDIDYRLASRALVGDAALAGKLRAVPALVYRIGPWRVESVSGYLAKMNAHERAVRLAAEFFADARTWPERPTYTITADECPVFDPPARSNGQRINAVTVDPVLAGAAVRFWDDAGLPIRDEQDIARHALRLMEIRWPYFAPNDSDLIAYLQMVAAVGAQLFLRRERFYTGALRVRLRTDLQPGRTFALRLANGRVLTAYIDALHHSVAREGGVLAGWTRISYSRGLYDGVERVVRPSAIRGSSTPDASRSVTGSWDDGESTSRSGSWAEPGTEVERPARVPTAVQARPSPSSGSRTGTWGETSTSPAAARGVLHDGVEISWPHATKLVRRLSTTTPADRFKRKDPAKIDILTLHYTDGFATDVAAPIRTLDSKGGDGAHFIAQPDGVLVQYRDLADTAIHVGQDDMNRRSIGIEIMCPGARQAPGPTQRPWPIVSGFWYGTNIGFKTREIYKATPEQEAAVVDLIRFLKQHFAVAVAAPAADLIAPKHLLVPKRGSRCDDPVSSGGLGIAVEPGVWHHVELYNPPEGRIDALGIIIPEILARV